MDIVEDMRRIALQEERLQFDGFDASKAWEVGLALKAVGEAVQLPIVVDIRLVGMPLLSFSLPGARQTISTGRGVSAILSSASAARPMR